MQLALGRQMRAHWNNVGYFPTPNQLVEELIDGVVGQLKITRLGEHVRVLDACAGDGRLGLALLDRLQEMGITCDLTCVEVDSSRIPFGNEPVPSVTWINENFLTSDLSILFDVVVSNPPYLVLNRRDAECFGIEWSEAVNGGRNLYTMSVARALDLCREGGIVGLIAPHGWLRNVTMSAFRERVNKLAASVDISAYQSRRLFDNVNQDTSIQIITRRTGASTSNTARVRIRYDKGEFIDAARCTLPLANDGLRVRIGAFVWNRERDAISTSSEDRRIPAIYGGNITQWHHLDLWVSRYKNRQYLVKSKVAQGAVSVGPCILVKRSMRGEPGRWEVDCAHVPRGFEIVAENHVIVIERVDQVIVGVGSLMCDLKYFLQDSCKHQGHPNLSVSSVREALSHVIKSYMQSLPNVQFE